MDLAVWLRSLGLEQYEATFRGEIKLTAVELHPTHRALAVHKFECASRGPVNHQDSLPKAERCRLLNKWISPATDRNTIPGTAARSRRYCQNRPSVVRRRRFYSWRTGLRSSGGTKSDQPTIS